MKFLDPRLPDRFWLKVIPEPNSGCWIWLAALNHAGYGKFCRGRRGLGWTRSHQAAYRALVGPIPDGLQLDHKCRTPVCCNPDHLEPVTNKVNQERRAAALLKCKNGHEFDVSNTHITKEGKRHCRACDRERHRVAARGGREP